MFNCISVLKDPRLETFEPMCKQPFRTQLFVESTHIVMHHEYGNLAADHYDDVIMGTIASHITSLTSVYSTVYSGADQSKHQSSASLAFVWGIHRDRWIPRTKGQLRGKCFHLMTSSWCNCHSASEASPKLETKKFFARIYKNWWRSLNKTTLSKSVYIFQGTYRSTWIISFNFSTRKTTINCYHSQYLYIMNGTVKIWLEKYWYSLNSEYLRKHIRFSDF